MCLRRVDHRAPGPQRDRVGSTGAPEIHAPSTVVEMAREPRCGDRCRVTLRADPRITLSRPPVDVSRIAAGLSSGDRPEYVVLGPVLCKACRQPVYFGWSFLGSSKWGLSRRAWRDAKTGSRHGCTMGRLPRIL